MRTTSRLEASRVVYSQYVCEPDTGNATSNKQQTVGRSRQVGRQAAGKQVGRQADKQGKYAAERQAMPNFTATAIRQTMPGWR